MGGRCVWQGWAGRQAWVVALIELKLQAGRVIPGARS